MNAFSLARTVILSLGMLVPVANSSFAEEDVNRGAAPPTRYDATADRLEAVGRPYGRVHRQDYRYDANGYYAYSPRGFFGDYKYPCLLSPSSLEHSACDNE